MQCRESDTLPLDIDSGRNRNVLVAQFFTLPTVQSLIAFIGAASTTS